MKRYVLAIDCGTQSIRASIFDEIGNLIIKKKKDFPPFKSIKPNYYEMNSNIFYEYMLDVCRLAREENIEIYNKKKHE